MCTLPARLLSAELCEEVSVTSVNAAGETVETVSGCEAHSCDLFVGALANSDVVHLSDTLRTHQEGCVLQDHTGWAGSPR